MAKFKDNFKKTEKKLNDIPQSMLKKLNDDLTFGFKYVKIKNGSYGLAPKAGKIKIKIENFDIENINQIKKNMEVEEVSFNDLIEYGYNSQTDIVIIPRKDFKQYLNDELVANDELFIGKQTINIEKGHFYITHRNMNEHFDLVMGSKNQKKKIRFKRAPIKSLKQKRFMSDDNEKLKIEYIINGNQIRFTIKLNFETIDSASDLYETIDFINAVFKEEYICFNHSSLPIGDVNDETGINDELVKIIKQIKAIEKILGVKFNPKKIMNSSRDDLETVNFLYKSLLDFVPTKKDEKINYFSYEMNNDNDQKINNLKKEIGKPVYFEHKFTFIDNLYDCEISLKGAVGFFDMVVDSIDKNNDTYYIYMDNVKDRKMSNSSIVFVNEKDLNKFMSDKNHIKILNKIKKWVP